MAAEATPTDAWLAAVPGMPALAGAAGVAERLLLLLHYGIDWQDGWVSRHRLTYWDRLLPDRVIVSTYRHTSLRAWWQTLAGELTCAPRSARERREVEELLRTDPAPVLQVLRDEAEALVLRVRIVADAVRSARPAARPVASR